MEPHDFTWLRLIRLPGIGPKTLWKLHAAAAARSVPLWELVSDAEGVAADRDVARVHDLLSQQDVDPVTEEHAALRSRQVALLHPDHPEYPPALVQHGLGHGLPPVLFARGHLPLARAAGIATAGSRTIEEDGIEFARSLAAELAGEGLNVVSGYAKGAGMAGHTGALRAGGTTTIALGLGILNFEAKSEIKPLLTDANTLVLSQFHPRARWMARNAMARNQLVCALSRAVVVIAAAPELDEQGRASGTFDTAKTALAMGVPVFVLSPGALRNPPAGNATLIRMGCRELFPEQAAAQLRGVLQGRSVSRDLEPQVAMF
jgi:DNA processing protein